jgi:hypothetical protein
MREQRGWTVQYVADHTDLADKTLYNLESRTPPAFVRSDTAQAICELFGLKLEKYSSWEAADRFIEWVPHSKGTDVDDVQLEQTGTLAKLAQMERSLDLHTTSLETPAGRVELLGLDRLKKVFTTPKHFADKGQLFAVSGKIDQHESMPSSVVKRLGAVDGEGAIFRITRSVSKRLPIYVTVFCPSGEITQKLMSAYDTGARVAMLVRVVFDPYKGPWRGFFFIETGAPKAKKFAFVVDTLL